MKAPFPIFTSRTSPCIPSAIFLLIMELQMSGIDSIVPVTSRREYILRSAGQISFVCPIIAIPVCSTAFRNSVKERSTRKPGIVSNLSRVPPVWPNPLPLIIGIANPASAKRGARMMDTLSPTPPVLCLSATKHSRLEKSIFSPELTIISTSE